MSALPPLPAVLPVRPPMPSAADQARSIRQAAKWQIVSEDFDDLLKEFMETRVDAGRLTAWGPADTSSNVLADMSRQFSTPGLYGTRPNVRHADTVLGPALVGPSGEMDQAGYWTLMQHVQYGTVGIGDFFVRFDADGDGLSCRVVLPQDVYIGYHAERPTVAIELRELRLRYISLGGEKGGQWIYAWDCYDLGETFSDGTERPPSYRVIAADPKVLVDLSELFLGTAGGLVGDAYPYRYRAGKAFIPFVHYRSVDSGTMWNDTHKRGATRGTMNAATHWTYAGHCARDASGRAVIAAGLMPIAGDTKNVGDPGMVRTIQLEPGAILYHSVQDGAQPFVHEVGPGGNLKEVSEFAQLYELRQLARWGIAGDDISKSGSDPASGAALFISRQGKREYSAQVRPLFERADLEAIRMSAALLRLADGPDYPEDGYSIEYAEIAQSPEEQKAERDDIDWDVEHGHISEVEAYMRRHPGTRREEAVAALVRAKVEAAELEAATQQALKEAGLDPSPAPTDAPTDTGTGTDTDTDTGTAEETQEPVKPAPPPGERVTINLTSTDVASIVTVDEARASQGLPAIGGIDGALTVAEYQAKHAAVIATAAAAADGTTTTT